MSIAEPSTFGGEHPLLQVPDEADHLRLSRVGMAVGPAVQGEGAGELPGADADG